MNKILLIYESCFIYLLSYCCQKKVIYDLSLLQMDFYLVQKVPLDHPKCHMNDKLMMINNFQMTNSSISDQERCTRDLCGQMICFIYTALVKAASERDGLIIKTRYLLEFKLKQQRHIYRCIYTTKTPTTTLQIPAKTYLSNLCVWSCFVLTPIIVWTQFIDFLSGESGTDSSIVSMQTIPLLPSQHF